MQINVHYFYFSKLLCEKQRSIETGEYIHGSSHLQLFEKVWTFVILNAKGIMPISDEQLMI